MTWLESIKSAVAPKYCSFVDGLDDDLPVGELVLIYSWSSVEERNETHEIEAYLPSHVAIGNDSGDNEFLIRRDGSPAVYQCDAGALGSDEPEEVHSDFEMWVGSGCPVPDDEVELPLPLHAPIWLLRPPENGLKGMFELRKLLGESWPSSDMRAMMDTVPTLLSRDGRPFALSGRLEDRPEYLACLGCGESPEGIVPLSTSVKD